MPHPLALSRDQSAPAVDAAAVDLSSTDATYTAPKVPTRLWVGGLGNVKVDMVGGGTVTFTAVAAGTLLPVCVTKVWRTGTTATLLVALFQEGQS